MKPDLVVLGHILNETIQFADGRTLGPVLGGPPSYFSVAAARLGARVGIVAKIAQDVPKELLRPIFEAGVDTRGLIVEPKGSTNLLIYHSDGTKTLEFLSQPVPLGFHDIPAEYLQAGIIYAGSAMWEPPLAVMRALHRQGIRLAADLGGYGGAHHDVRHSNEGYEPFLRELLPYLEVVKASREDCSTLFADPTLAPEQCARALVAWGAKVGIVTMGPDGALVATSDELFRVPTLTRNAVDSTGAGDVFSAGFLVYYHKHGDPQEAGLFASATAAVVCERTGGVLVERMPTLGEVKARIKQYREL